MSNQKLCDDLKKVLADSYALYLKTHNFHWNVTGPHFVLLHELFEGQYKDLAEAIDDIAELIRGLGEKAPGTWAKFDSIRVIKDGDENADAKTMIAELAADQDTISITIQNALEEAQKSGDEVIVGAMAERLTVHRKNKWMLESSL